MLLFLALLVGNLRADVLSQTEWVAEAKARCAVGQEQVIYTSDFKWGLPLGDAPALFDKMYSNAKRLEHHVYFLGDEFVSDYPGLATTIRVDANFLYNLKLHIEKALTLEFAQWVFFPDMGHNHFFIPNADYERVGSLPRKEMMEEMLKLSELKVLYHTAEQIQLQDEDKKLLQDTWSQWRYFTRNFIGDNKSLSRLDVLKDLTGSYNTAKDLEGHRYWGGGVNISANEKGCFSYEHKGKTYHFDVSFYDLPMDPNDNAGDY